MSAENDDIQTKLIAAMLSVMELHEKFATYGTKEISALVTSAITSKTKKPTVINQLNKLETMLEDLRTSIAKASMRALLAFPKESKESEDPVAAVPEKAQEPEVEVKKAVKKVKEAEPAVKEPAKPKKAEKAKEEAEEVPKATKSKKKEEPTTNVVEILPAPKATKAKKDEKKEEVQVVSVPSAPLAPVPVVAATTIITTTTTTTTSLPVALPTPTPVALPAPTPAPIAPPARAPSPPSPPAEDKSDEDTAPLHVRRKNIPKHIKTMVWNVHMGRDILETKCFCCQVEKVDARSFQCGHVIAEAKGGDLTIKNLRPICQPCNASMGTRSMNEFAKEYFGRTV